MRKFGLIGRSLEHSFSPMYFSEKFFRENIDAVYDIYELENIDNIHSLFHAGITGLNVTIPYKQEVLPFLDELDELAIEIGAVNTIQVQGGKTKGYNTDVIGFRDSLMRAEAFYNLNGKALILGTGGASKAVAFVLKTLGFTYSFISRTKGDFTYENLPRKLVKECHLIVNTTPLGTMPHIEESPLLPYDEITENHLLYDLIYNPKKTLFLTEGERRGAAIMSGGEMLVIQAEAAWEIWNY